MNMSKYHPRRIKSALQYVRALIFHFGGVGKLSKRIFDVLRLEGLAGFKIRSQGWIIRQKAKSLLKSAAQAEASSIQSPEDIYDAWIRYREPTPVERDRLRSSAQTMIDHPNLVIIVRLDQDDPNHATATLDSLFAQYLKKWSLLLLLSPSAKDELKKIASEAAKADQRISLFTDGETPEYNDPSPLIEDKYIAWLTPGDILAPWALYRMAEKLKTEPDAALVYSDSDDLNAEGRRINPRFQPDWAPDTFLSGFYDLGLAFVRGDLFGESIALENRFDGIFPASLQALRHIEGSRNIAHISEVLLHRGQPLKRNVDEERRAIQSTLDDLGIPAHVAPGKWPGFHRIRYDIPGRPLVSVVIPTASRKNPQGEWWVLQCVQSIREKTTWGNLEIVITDNDDMPEKLAEALDEFGVVRGSYTEKSFNLSQKINQGVAASTGEYVLVMNDDMEVLEPSWIEAMLEHAQRPEIGAVGALLLYPDKTIQHAGVMLMPYGPVHVNQHLAENDPGLGAYHWGVHNVLITTGACIMTRRTVHDHVGGWAESFPLDFNDADLCLKIIKSGFRIVVTPHARLHHFESVSRDVEENELQRALNMTSLFMSRWINDFKMDPFSNPNFTYPSPLRCDMSLNVHEIHCQMIPDKLFALRAVEPQAPAPPGLFSFLTTVWNTPVKYLSAMAESLLRQTDRHAFEWVVLDNGTTDPGTRAWMEQNLADHPSVSFFRVEENQGIVGGMRLCLERATGRYVVPLDSDDILWRDALDVLTCSVVTEGYPPLLYTDEDVIDEDDHCVMYFFKPEWDPVLNAGACFNVHVSLFDRRIALDIGVYSDLSANGCHDWDTIFRFDAAGYRKSHIPAVIYSWRQHDTSCAKNTDSKDYIKSSQKFVLQRFADQRAGEGVYKIRHRPGFDELNWQFLRRKPLSPYCTLLSVIGTGHTLDSAAQYDTAEGIARHFGLKPFPHKVSISGDDPVGTLGEVIHSLKSCPDDSHIYVFMHPLHLATSHWFEEPGIIMELFPDTVGVGGSVFDVHGKVLEAGQYFGIGVGCDNPIRGGIYHAPPFWQAFINRWRTVNAIAFSAAVFRLDFLRSFLKESDCPPFTPVAMLGPWLGLFARQKNQRLVHSPYMTAIAPAPLMSYEDNTHWRAFRKAAGDELNNDNLLHPFSTRRVGHGFEMLDPSSGIPFHRFF